MDGIYLKRNWGGEFKNVSILVAIAVNEDGYQEVIGIAEGMKEDDKVSWVSFFQWLKSRDLDDVTLIVGDKYLGMLEAVFEVFPDAKYQRCIVHFYRNIFSVVSRSKMKTVVKMLKAIHASGYLVQAQQLGRVRDLFKYPPEIQKIIYTTNMIEAKGKVVFPTDESLLKMLYLVS